MLRKSNSNVRRSIERIRKESEERQFKASEMNQNQGFFNKRISNLTHSNRKQNQIPKIDFGLLSPKTVLCQEFKKTQVFKVKESQTTKQKANSDKLPSIFFRQLETDSQVMNKHNQNQQKLLRQDSNNHCFQKQKQEEKKKSYKSQLSYSTQSTIVAEKKCKSETIILISQQMTRSLEQVLVEDVLCQELINDFNNNCGKVTIEMNPDDIQKKDFLQGHTIKEGHRFRLLDWMVQVFRVLKQSSPQTYFLSVSILDKFLAAKQNNFEVLHHEDLYLIGLTIILISSKYEDVIPIKMSQILQEAGHSRFKQYQILKKELEILQSIKFQIHTSNIYDQTSQQFLELVHKQEQVSFLKDDLNFALDYLLFICQISTYSMSLTLKPDHILSLSIIRAVLSFMKLKMNYETLIQFGIKQKQNCQQSYQKWVDLSQNSKSLYGSSQNMALIKIVKKEILEFHEQSQKLDDKKNLSRNFPQFLGKEIVPYALKESYRKESSDIELKIIDE